MALTDRMPDIPRDKMTAEQKEVYDEVAAGPRGAVYGPFVPLLRSPELMRRLQKTGEYLRYRSELLPRLSELAILLIARQWTQQFEWHHHHPIALERGLKVAITQAIAEGRRPASMSEDEESVYEFCAELREHQSVCDKTYARALATLGEQGVVELVVLQGYYTMMAMVMNVARSALPAGAIPALAPLPP